MTEKKFKLGKKEANGLHGIIALRSFSNVKKGDVGGFIEKEENLSHNGDAWVYGNALVYGDARVSGRFDVTCRIDFELPRITLNTTEKAEKLRKFLLELEEKVTK